MLELSNNSTDIGSHAVWYSAFSGSRSLCNLELPGKSMKVKVNKNFPVYPQKTTCPGMRELQDEGHSLSHPNTM